MDTNEHEKKNAEHNPEYAPPSKTQKITIKITTGTARVAQRPAQWGRPHPFLGLTATKRVGFYCLSFVQRDAMLQDAPVNARSTAAPAKAVAGSKNRDGRRNGI